MAMNLRNFTTAWLLLILLAVVLPVSIVAIETPGSSVPPQGRGNAGWHQKNEHGQNSRLKQGSGGQPALRPHRQGNRGPQEFAARFGDQQQGSPQAGQGMDQQGNTLSDDVRERGGGPVKELFPGDRVPLYTRKMHHKAAVALVAFVSATILSVVLVKLVLSKTSIFLSLVFATGCLFSCYTKGDFGQFSSALGVGTILFMKKLRPRQFFVTACRQFLAAVMLSQRRPFPPVENPWRCKDVLDASDVPYSMVNCILAMVFAGMIIGFNIGSLVPFFPAWIGGLVSSFIFAYISTTRNPKGDFLRYLGHSINVLVSDVFTCAEDVYLKEKTGIFLNRTFSFVHHVDKRFGVLGKVQALFNGLLDVIRKAKNDAMA